MHPNAVYSLQTRYSQPKNGNYRVSSWCHFGVAAQRRPSGPDAHDPPGSARFSRLVSTETGREYGKASPHRSRRARCSYSINITSPHAGFRIVARAISRACRPVSVLRCSTLIATDRTAARLDRSLARDACESGDSHQSPPSGLHGCYRTRLRADRKAIGAAKLRCGIRSHRILRLGCSIRTLNGLG